MICRLRFRLARYPGANVRVAIAGLFLIVVALGLRSASVRAQAPGPRTAWGDPDLQGVWDFGTLTPIERPEELADKAILTEAEAAEFVAGAGERTAVYRERFGDRNVGGDAWPAGPPATLNEERRSSQIVDPPNGRLPPLTAAEQARTAGRRPWDRPVRVPIVVDPLLDGPEDLGLFERCIVGFTAPLVPLIPFGNYITVLQIIQSPGVVAIVMEAVHETRVVRLDDSPHVSDAIRQYAGDARGRWDGDTLVVETRHFSDRAGSFRTVNLTHGTGEALRLTERFTRVEANRILYEYTVTDPATFTRPFSGRLLLGPAEGDLHEFGCHEGNSSVTHALRGARVQEGSLPPVPVPPPTRP